MSSSSPPDAPPAHGTHTVASIASSSSRSSPSRSLTPSQGLKRPRDVEGNQRQPSAPSSSSHGDEPPAKRLFQSPSTSSTAASDVSPVAAVGDSLRISNELLRGENEAVQVELASLRADKAAASEQLKQQKLRIRNLEEDLTRIYRRQKRDAETRQQAHETALASLREQLERTAKQLEDRPALDPSMALLTPETTREMDTFVAMCTQWQAKLATLSAQLASQVGQLEADQLRDVMDGMVENVSQAHQASELQAAEKQIVMQRIMMQQKEQDMQDLVERMKAERDEVEAFEALERRVLEDRVGELDTSVENAKENERVLLQQMANLREELVKMRSGNHVMPNSEWEHKLEEDAHMKEQVEALNVRCEAQNVQLTLLREDLASLQTENDELAADLTARKQAAAGDDDTASIVTKQLEDRVTELKEQLADVKKEAREAEAELRNDHAARIQETTESLNNRIEVLTMNVDAKASVIEGLNADKAELVAKLSKRTEALERTRADAGLLQEQLDAKLQQLDKLRSDLVELQSHHETELKQAQNEAATEKVELEKQMTSKMVDWVEVNHELKDLKEQIVAMTTEVQNLKREKAEVESKNAELRHVEERLPSMQTEVATLEEKNKKLLAQQIHRSSLENRVREQLTTAEREKEELQIENHELRMQFAAAEAEKESVNDGGVKGSLEHPFNGRVTLSPQVQARIAKLLVEKSAVENFLRCYFDTAEAKCHVLSQQVAQLEAKQATHRQHASDSCHLLRMCAQVDSCDSTVRASILDAMTTLERIS